MAMFPAVLPKTGLITTGISVMVGIRVGLIGAIVRLGLEVAV